MAIKYRHDPVVFRGSLFRVQLTVFDRSRFRDPDLRTDAPPTFTVRALHNTARRSTAFVRGKLLYHGTDPQVALGAIRKYVPWVRLGDLPRSWRSYFKEVTHG